MPGLGKNIRNVPNRQKILLKMTTKISCPPHKPEFTNYSTKEKYHFEEVLVVSEAGMKREYLQGFEVRFLVIKGKFYNEPT